MSTPAKQPASPPTAASTNPLLPEVMKWLLKTGQYSDMTVTCQGFKFPVHRAILCSQSLFFRAAMDGNFKEAETKTIDFTKDDPETIERVLSYLYTRDYSADGHLVDMDGRLIQSKDANSKSPEESKGHEEEGEIKDGNHDSATTENPKATGSRSGAYNHTQVYIAADKYAIGELKKLAAKRFRTWCEENWKSAAFCDAIVDVMTMTPLHDTCFQKIIVQLVSKHIVELTRDGAIIYLFETFGNLGAAVISDLVQEKRIRMPGVLGFEEGKIAALDELSQKANSIRTCRHCSQPMNVKFERAEYFEVGYIRCAQCNTRH
ncbi:BTB/POZ domain-containing protein [Aspergillus lucknowensis]|uniref:BTB/POZ protein n=1 Tax=Aspergillus lucknowensis TaxID=176173 RepID=A0ABR4M023_9EURO